MKQTIFKILSQAERLKYRSSKLANKNALTILNFHRVSPRYSGTYSGISPELFEEIVVYLKNNFNLCLFNEISELTSSQPKLIISFDDGYKDFIDYAAPILDKHKVRVNQNVIPNCIETSIPPVNVLLQDFIGSAPFELIKKIPIDFDVKDLMRMNRVDLGRRGSFLIKYLPHPEFISKQEELLSFLLTYPELLEVKMMDKKDVLEISSEHEIGVHSYEHLSMANQTLDYFRNDLIRCREYFSDELNISNDIYAFPNGSAALEQIDMAREAGFNKILMVNEKFSYPPFNTFNRFTFDAKTLPEAKFKIYGRMVRI